MRMEREQKKMEETKDNPSTPEAKDHRRLRDYYAAHWRWQ